MRREYVRIENFASFILVEIYRTLRLLIARRYKRDLADFRSANWIINILYNATV